MQCQVTTRPMAMKHELNLVAFEKKCWNMANGNNSHINKYKKIKGHISVGKPNQNGVGHLQAQLSIEIRNQHVNHIL